MFERYFPQEEYEDRWARLHSEMKARNTEVAVIFARGGGTYERFQDVYYLSNFYSLQSGQSA